MLCIQRAGREYFWLRGSREDFTNYVLFGMGCLRMAGWALVTFALRENVKMGAYTTSLLGRGVEVFCRILGIFEKSVEGM